MMKKYASILKFYEEYVKLEQIIRKGWIMRGVPADRLESVADHTLQLLMLSSVITKELNIEIDSKRLMEMLLIHDLGEVIIGDVSEVEVKRGVKKINENKSVKMILDNLSQENSDYYYGLWLEMESKNTEIGKFAYLLDKIDAVIKAGMYELEYNVAGLFDEFYNFQKQRCTFENSVLEDFFNYIELKYNIDNN